MTVQYEVQVKEPRELGLTSTERRFRFPTEDEARKVYADAIRAGFEAITERVEVKA